MQVEEDKESLAAKLSSKRDDEEPIYIGGMTRPIVKRLSTPMTAQQEQMYTKICVQKRQTVLKKLKKYQHQPSKYS